MDNAGDRFRANLSHHDDMVLICLGFDLYVFFDGFNGEVKMVGIDARDPLYTGWVLYE